MLQHGLHASIPAQRAVNRRTASQHNLHIVRSIEIADVLTIEDFKGAAERE